MGAVVVSVMMVGVVLVIAMFVVVEGVSNLSSSGGLARETVSTSAQVCVGVA